MIYTMMNNNYFPFNYQMPQMQVPKINWSFGSYSSSGTGLTGTTSTFKSTGDPEMDAYLKRQEREEKEAQERLAKQQEERQLEEQKKESYDVCKEGLKQIKQQKKSIQANKKSDGSSTITPGVDVSAIEKKSTGDKAARWGKNALASLWNMGKGLLGFDDKGFNIGKLALNIGLGVAAAGLCCIPGVGLAMLTAGALYGGYKMIDNGIKAYNASDKADELVDKIKAKQEKLEKATSDKQREKLEKELEDLQAQYIANEQKIDEAQQGTVSNGVIAVTSAVGGYRMINSTAGAVTGSGVTGKLSAFGKNSVQCAKNEFGAWKSWSTLSSTTKTNFNNMVGQFTKLSDKSKFETGLNNQTNAVDARLSEIDAQTDKISRMLSHPNLTPSREQALIQKQRLLLHEKSILNLNKQELGIIGNNSVTKAQVDALRANNTSSAVTNSISEGTFARQLSPTEYELVIPGSGRTFTLSADEYTAYAQRILDFQQNKASMSTLIGQHDNMMFSMGNWKWLNWNKDNARVEAYLGGKVNVGKPQVGFVNITKKANWGIANGNFAMTKEQVAMNINQSMGQIAAIKTTAKQVIPALGSYMITPGSNVLKARVTDGWGISDPITSNPFSGAIALTAEQVKQSEKALEENEKTLNEINSKISRAKTTEEVTNSQLYLQAYTMVQQEIAQSGETKGATMADVEKKYKELMARVEEEMKAQAQAQAQAQQQATDAQQEAQTTTAP